MWSFFGIKAVGRTKLPIPGVAVEVAETCELLAFAVDIEP
jgi:hypothetical protein